MQILKVVTQIITSKLSLRNKESTVYKLDDIESKISFSISRYYPPDLIESFDINFELVIIFPQNGIYIFECKDQLFFENSQKRPDENFLFKSAELSMERIGWILYSDFGHKGLTFINEVFGDTNLLEMRKGTRKALDLAYT